MTSERQEGATPAGGAYCIAVYVNLETLEEVDRNAATGIVITEYDANDCFLVETVGMLADGTGEPSG
jgi:hypothetical protein